MPLFEGAEVWEALAQIAEKGYDAGDLPADATGRTTYPVVLPSCVSTLSFLPAREWYS